jgi:hypothetical protein
MADGPAESNNIAEYMNAHMAPEQWEHAADAADGIERAEHAADEVESGGADAEEEERDSRQLLASAEQAVDGERADVRASKFADQDTLLTALDPSAGVPGGWGGSSASKEGGEEDSSSTAAATSGAAALVPGTCYFNNPLYFPVRHGGTGAKKDELIFPLYTLFHYHGLLFAATGPLIRKMFPKLVSHSSHVEGKFSEMRRETAGSLPLEDYVRAKISGDNSLMVGRCRLTVSKPELKARLVSALETKMRRTAFKRCFQIQLAPLHHGGRPEGLHGLLGQLATARRPTPGRACGAWVVRGPPG